MNLLRESSSNFSDRRVLVASLSKFYLWENFACCVLSDVLNTQLICYVKFGNQHDSLKNIFERTSNAVFIAKNLTVLRDKQIKGEGRCPWDTILIADADDVQLINGQNFHCIIGDPPEKSLPVIVNDEKMINFQLQGSLFRELSKPGPSIIFTRNDTKVTSSILSVRRILSSSDCIDAVDVTGVVVDKILSKKKNQFILQLRDIDFCDILVLYLPLDVARGTFLGMILWVQHAKIKLSSRHKYLLFNESKSKLGV